MPLDNSEPMRRDPDAGRDSDSGDPMAVLFDSPLDSGGSRGPRWNRHWVWALALGFTVIGLVWWNQDTSSPTDTSGAATVPSTSLTPSSSGSTSTGSGAGVDLRAEVPTVDAFGEVAFVPELDRVVLVGGIRIPSPTTIEPVEGTWLLDPTSDTWLRVDLTRELPPRFGHAVAATDNRVVVFGGADDRRIRRCSDGGWCAEEAYGDTWLWDSATGEWTEVEGEGGPSARYGAAMALDPQSGDIILFGGAEATNQSGTDLLADTWRFDPDTGTWFNPGPDSGPPARGWHRMLHDPETGNLLVIGGIGSNSDRTWAYEPEANTWEELESNPIGARWGIAAAVDPETGLLYAAGGETFSERAISGGTASELTLLDEVWVRTGATWQPYEPFLFPFAGSGVLDPTTQRFVVYASSMTRHGSFTVLLDPDAATEWTLLDATAG